jgi:hypothetical protein
MIGLPEELYLKAKKTIVKTGKYGYSSISEFVKDAVRRRYAFSLFNVVMSSLFIQI